MSTKMDAFKHVLLGTLPTNSPWPASNALSIVRRALEFIWVTVSSVKMIVSFRKMAFVWKVALQGIHKVGTVWVIMSVSTKDADCAVQQVSAISVCPITQENLLVNGSSSFHHFSCHSLSCHLPYMRCYQPESSCLWKESLLWLIKSSFHSHFWNSWLGFSLFPPYTLKNKLCSWFRW